MDNRDLPDWLVIHSRYAFLGEIYPEIRFIAMKYEEDKQKLLIRYYMDRIPIDKDYESLELVYTNLFSATDHLSLIKDVELECVHYIGYVRDADPLDGFFYARREYED